MEPTVTEEPTTSEATAATPPAVAPVAPAAPTAAAPQKSGTNYESLAVAGFVFGLFAMAIAVFAIGLAARAVSEAGGSGGGGGGGGGGTAPATLDVVLADFSIDPAEASISAGGTINLVNEGAVQHDLVVDTDQSEMLEPGASGTMTLGTVTAGEYTVYCSVPGHREAGMEGTFTVQ